MSPNSLWTQIKLTVLSSIPNCSCPSPSQQHKYAKNQLLSLLQTRIHGSIDLSFSSLGFGTGVYAILSKCNTFKSFSLLDQFPPVSQLKHIPRKTGLSGVTTTRRLALFSKSFYGLPIGSFPTFKGPFISLAKTPLKCLVSGLLTFQQCHFKLPMGPRSCWYPWK